MRLSALIAALAFVAPLAAGDAPAPAPTPAPAPQGAPTAGAVDPATLRKQVSYLVGTQLKAMVDRTVKEGDLDQAELMRGFQEAVEGKAASVPQDQQQALFEAYGAQLQAKQAEAGQAASADNKAFLTENGKKPGVMTTASGLQYEVVKKGPEGGKQPVEASTVKVNYVGKLRDGTVFDASEKHGGPATFPLNGVIKGWTEGLQLMHEGDSFRFTIPSELAYGEQGPPGIGPNQVLIFDVDLISVVK
jgi:FKBP-type peptidyl-prolyl cis-trans isomerase